ncbi:MAG: hypothetical protein ABIH99_05700 [Candidatus Micrarchaeota archaeon]
MQVLFSESAEKDLDGMERSLKAFFFQHIQKLEKIPPRRHLKFGLPYNVEDVTKQARLVYNLEAGTLYILRCFKNHKEYEKWYSSYK